MTDQCVAVSLRVEDAFALVMGLRDYMRAATAGDVPTGGRPLRACQDIAVALAEARPDICSWKADQEEPSDGLREDRFCWKCGTMETQELKL